MTTAKTPVAAMSTEDLLPMLRVIAESTERSEPLNSRDLSRQLGWSDAVTAASLAAARERLLIWGMRTGGSATPLFEDIELTVQGGRLLLASDRMRAGEPPESDRRPSIGPTTS